MTEPARAEEATTSASDRSVPVTSAEKAAGGADSDHASDRATVVRRDVIVAGGVLAATVGIAVATAACDTGAQGKQEPATGTPAQAYFPDVPAPPDSPPPLGVYKVLTPAQARTVDALAARIMPGSPDDPGAREAGVTTYIDSRLAFHDGYDQPTYTHPPFPKTYEGDSPPSASPGPDMVWVKKEELDRYGFQLKVSPLEAYRKGLDALDKYAQSKFGGAFADLPESQQDSVIEDVEDGNTTGFDTPTDKEFFKMVRADVINGMFSDPLYGGNRNLAGWKLVGYPGAMRAYTPHDLITEGAARQPQGLEQLMPFHPGQPADPNAVLPVSGSRMHGDASYSSTTGRPGPGQ